MNQLQKFVHSETRKQLKEHHLFLTQLFLLSKEHEKEENEGKPLTVFQTLLLYLSEIIDRNDVELNNYLEMCQKIMEK
jgi:hypothetical protein